MNIAAHIGILIWLACGLVYLALMASLMLVTWPICALAEAVIWVSSRPIFPQGIIAYSQLIRTDLDNLYASKSRLNDTCAQLAWSMARAYDDDDDDKTWH